MSVQDQHLDTLEDIRRMMKRSSRFISLSGLSGIAAGLWALVGSYFAFSWIGEYRNSFNNQGYSGPDFHKLKVDLLLLAVVILIVSVISALYFTWRKAGKDRLPLWDHTAKMLTLNIAIPLVAGGIFIMAMLQYDEWRFVAPACLIFYGLSLVNGSKYTLSEIRYLGISEIVLGLVCTQFIGNGLYFWAVGFGMLHIIYGFAMWRKYEGSRVVED
jgi:hypothetical protein